ncbi:MAG: triose-phosphate isomerase [Planctomycetota bacterium]|nr:triose-phosphate isomerase [Planctomycetaceae bacterium]MDQ3329707.1 triose-phosphate isomerase [Planctomycetota bacterium]
MRRMFVAGNWKMNTDRAGGTELARAIAKAVPADAAVDVLVAPPLPYLLPIGEAIAGSGVALGAQNAYFEPPGAFTGETSIGMLKDVGCRYVILGHSERRQVLRETDETINKKVAAAVAAGLGVILCVGETLDERDGGTTEKVLETQLSAGLKSLAADAVSDLVIAYEPVWAIGTGRNATPEQAQAAHAFIRSWLSNRFGPTVGAATRIQYGGSVKPDNAAQLLGQPDVDGALVGGASLKADSFLAIVQAAQQVGAARR